MAVPPPPGVYVPVPTFFKTTSSSNTTSNTSNLPNNTLDLTTQAAHSLHLARSGIRGLVLLGSTGEAVHITSSERRLLIRSVRQALDSGGFPKYPLIVGTAAQSVEEVLSQLEDARSEGADWGLVLVPGFFAGAVEQEGVVRWFEQVAGGCGMGVLIYHYPGVSNNVKVLPSTYARLSQNPNIVGCKLSHGDLSTHAQIALHPSIDHTSFHVFTGLGQQLLPVLAVGCAGTIDGSAGFFPRCVVRLYELGVKEAPSKEEVKERRELQYKVCAVEELVVRFGTVGIKEAVSRVLGMGERDGTRLPLCGGIPGGDTEWENWTGVVGELESVEKRLAEG